jgi:outer membrane protein assembly complex protein YaeT
MRRLLLLLWFPTLAWAQQSYYGTTASSIQLSEGAEPTDLERITIRQGDIIQPENVRASIQALFDTGRYRAVEVDAAASGNGTQLTFRATPHYFFSTFTLQPQKLLDRPMSTLLRLPVGQKFSESRVQDVRTQTEQLLQDAGYFNPSLTTTYGPDTDFRLRTVEFTADVGERARIGKVTIQGAEGVFSANELRDSLDVSTGSRYNAVDVDRGIAAIRRKFLDRDYLNTRVDAVSNYQAATNTVDFSVTIVPGQKTVIEIIDAGPNPISAKEMRELIPVFEEGLFDSDLIREGRANIIEALQQKGYFDPRIEGPVFIPAKGDAPARIIVTIDGGERHTLRSIEFNGNSVVSDKELQDIIKIRKAGAFTFLNHGLFSNELLRADVQTIQNLYRRLGYEAAFVDAPPPENTPDHEIHVVFEIIENMRYPIQRIVFTGNEILPESDLRAAIRLKEGDFYSPRDAEEAQTQLARLYFSMGFPEVRIEATADRDPETENKVLTYRITEGPRYRIRRILISGNTKTAEKVVKRTSELKEDTWFDPGNVLSAQQKLYATGLFKHVDIAPLDRVDGENRIVLIQVEESEHITVAPGVGVKEYAGPRATLDVTHNNMFGLNQTLSFRFRVGVHEQQYQTSYRQPRLFNRDNLEGYGTLTLDQRNRPSYTASGWEFSLQIRQELSRTQSLLATASYQTVDLQNIKLNPAVRQNPDEEGIIQIARLGFSYVTDTRDDLINPYRGVFGTGTFQIANRVWGSEVNFLSLSNQINYHMKYGRGTFAFSERVGWKIPYGQTEELPITERYFAGGSTSLRGFGLDEAGPPGGGQLLTIGNVEYRVPFKSFSIGTLGGAVFYDTGNVFEHPSDFSLKDFTHSAGAGLRFQTPVGPVRFDVGFNLFPKTRIDSSGNSVREERVHLFFTLGHTF